MQSTYKGFDVIKTKSPGRNKFDLSHQKKFSMSPGLLYPILVTEALPGDSFRVNTDLFMRMAPMLAPIMHDVDVTIHYFGVPERLVWDSWEDFITGGRLGTSNPAMPMLLFNEEFKSATAEGTLADFIGVPDMTGFTMTETLKVRASFFRAYQLTYNEYYRDQNLIADLDINMGSGDIPAGGTEWTKLLTLRRRAWMKDYFTSALPFAQRGPEVLVPMEATDITYRDEATIKSDGGAITPGNAQLINVGGDPDEAGRVVSSGANTFPLGIENVQSVNNASITMADLRRAEKLQEWLELNARAGGRYAEQLRAQWGVTSDDARLQRPEYLGGGVTPLRVSEVVSTFQQTQDEAVVGPPQANMAGHGVAIGQRNGFKRFFTEHTIILGIMSITPKPAYQQGLNRMLSRTDRFDFFWTQFAHIGEQAIKNKELYLDGEDLADGEETFGYNVRYCEYRYIPDTVHGAFKSSLSFWHWGQIFFSKPQLNKEFIECDPDARIFAVENNEEQYMYCNLRNNISALRPIPYFGTPSW